MILKSELFTVNATSVLDLDDVDADFVFDCRGKPKDFSNYLRLKNPTNAAILAKPNWDTTKEFWSRHIATPDGWTFVIPTSQESPSHDYCVGYCYNRDITDKVEAELNFQKLFDVNIKKHIEYDSYVTKTPTDGRVILNGNRLFFLEPLEATSLTTSIRISDSIKKLQYDNDFENQNKIYNQWLNEVIDIIMLHYLVKPPYKTKFWIDATSQVFIP